MAEPLGEPLGIEDVAKLIGTSAWSVRQTLLRAGLPHVRFNRRGRLIFYRNQVEEWLRRFQEKSK